MPDKESLSLFGMNRKRWFALLLVAILVMGMAGGVLADGEAADAPGDAAGGTRLVRSKVADLGKVPDETKMEERCEVLLVADVSTGVPVREKNIRIAMPISGANAQMMTVLTALDYLTLDESIIVTKAHLQNVPDSKVRLGLKEKNDVFVSDLVAAMLLTGAADAAKVVADETVARAGAGSIGELMQQKGNELQLLATDYSGCDGICSDTLLLTNAVDQCEVYLALLANAEVASILETGTYEVVSRYDNEATAALAEQLAAEAARKAEEQAAKEAAEAAKAAEAVRAAAKKDTDAAAAAATEAAQTSASNGDDNAAKTANKETEKAKRVVTDEEGRVLVAENTNLPSTIKNTIKAVVPEERTYDVRLSSAVSGVANSAKKDDRYSVVYFRARSDRADLVMLYWLPGGSSNVPANYLVYLTDTFTRAKIVDLIPYVEVATAGLAVEKSGIKVSGWSLQSGHAMYGRVLSAYDPEAYAKVNQEAMSDEYQLADMKVILKADVGTMIANDDGSRTMQAKVLVDNSVEGTVTLETAPKAVQTEISQNTNTVYTDDDIMPEEPTLMSQYGWIVIIGGVVLLGLIVIIIGVAVRNRMEH